jgi:basic membrane protein A
LIRERFVIFLLLSVIAAQCGMGAGGPQKVKIALVLPAAVDDLAGSQSMYEGVMAVQKELGQDKVEVSVAEKLGNPLDATAALRDYATDGFDIVIAHGSQYRDAVLETAGDFPNTSFAYGTASLRLRSGQAEAAANVFAYDPQVQQGAYLLGIIAASMTRSGKVGVVGPVEAGDALRFNEGFKQGVASVNPAVEVAIAYNGSPGDSVKAAELANSEIDNGADILTGTDWQAVGAIRAARERGVYWLSGDMDSSSLAPATVLAALEYDWKDVVTRMVKARAEGKKGGEHLTLDFANGRLQLVYNDKLIPPEVRARVEEARKAMVEGRLIIKQSSSQARGLGYAGSVGCCW